jgi:hypothetical protein
MPTDRVSRRPGRLLLAAGLGLLTVAGAAQAQQQAPTGPRYLSWANRTTSTTPASIAAARVRSDIIPRRVAPSNGVARPQMQPFNPPMPVSDGGLTPASAWIGPRVAPAFAPGVPDPLSYATTEMAAAPSPPPPVRTQPPAPVRTAPVARVEAPSPAPVERSAAPPTYAPPAPADADPMAPRRDAPIFRLQSQGAPLAAADGVSAQPPREPSDAAPVQTAQTGQPQARYYSVHRAAGRQPDPLVMPDPVFFDSVALDLAAPPEIEPPVRDGQGRRQPVANSDPSLP